MKIFQKITRIKSLLCQFIQTSQIWGIRIGLKKEILFRVFHIYTPKHLAILEYLEKKYNHLIAEYKNRPVQNDAIDENSNIWVCWFQGEENMPKLVKRCFRSIKEHAGTHPVVLVTFDNFNDYVNFPSYILDKVNNKQITLTHFSDILRSALLTEHGGIWIDSTMLLTRTLEIPQCPFFSIKRDIHDTQFYSYQWTAFFLAGIKDNVVCSFLKDFLFEYHKKETNLIDYYLIDYIIAVGYRNIPEIKRQIDMVPFTNKYVLDLYPLLGMAYNEDEFKRLTMETGMFKLNWKELIYHDDNSFGKHLGFE